MSAKPKHLPRLCVSIGCESPERWVELGSGCVEEGESFFEIRLDWFASPASGFPVIERFCRSKAGCILIATCRRRVAGGRFEGAPRQQVEVLRAAARAGASIVDLEIESAEQLPSLLPSLREGARLLLSYHNFERTPALGPVAKRLLHFQADYYKIAVHIGSFADLSRLFSFPRQFPRLPFVLVGMGDIGLASRILLPSRGSLFTYASPSGQEPTAPGQVPAVLMRELFRVPKLTRATRVFGVIADPVAHSISPQVHNRAFQARRLDAVYVPFRVPSSQLKQFMSFAAELPMSGFSVTIPHKQKILRYLDSVDPLARRIGAVNTVWRKAGRWRGCNTDAEAIVQPLSRYCRLRGASVLVVGTGGAARSAVFALREVGAKVFITGRNPAHIRLLARASGAEGLERSQLDGRYFDILVHATPLGMYPATEECFFQDSIPADIVFDLVYNPPITLLLRKAAEQGKVTISGLEMFLHQAARQFEIWTSTHAPLATMKRAAVEALATFQSTEPAPVKID